MNRRTVSRTDADRFARSEGFEVFTRPQRSRPARLLGLAIRLRAEIIAAILAITAWVWLTDRMPAWVAGLILAALAVGLALLPPARRFLLRRALAVLTRHRLRAVFVQRRVMNWTGNVPILLWSRPTPVGERVWLILRAGIDAGDVERNLGHIAAGCHARTARVTAHRSVSSIAMVDVIRRDPLRDRATNRNTTPAARPARPSLHVVPDQQKGA
jgi:hypothetical protein